MHNHLVFATFHSKVYIAPVQLWDIIIHTYTHHCTALFLVAISKVNPLNGRDVSWLHLAIQV